MSMNRLENFTNFDVGIIYHALNILIHTPGGTTDFDHIQAVHLYKEFRDEFTERLCGDMAELLDDMAAQGHSNTEQRRGVTQCPGIQE